MLQAAGVAFELVDTVADEEAAKERLRHLDAGAMALALAELKAVGASGAGDALVMGSDQTLEREDGSMINKPASRAEAMEQLRSLSGATHRLHSAAVVTEAGRAAWRHVESVSLTMRRLSDAFLEGYLDREYDAIRWNVGGYRIEGLGVQLFELIVGSHFAILGLPLLPLLSYLREREVLGS